MSLNRRELILGATATASGAAQRTLRPNILHIMTDQQQWGTIAGRSECRTPNLNRLAESGMLFERSYTPSAVCCPARAMILSGAYHWHNGVYNQVHSPPSVHRDMNPDVVLYSNRLRDAGYQLGYVGKWHASFVRTPIDFGFHEVADLQGCDPRLIRKLDVNPDNVQRAREPLKRVATRMMQWPGSEPFVMWGHREGSEEATPEFYRAECAIRMMKRFARGERPWHLEVHFVEPHDPYMPLKKYLDHYEQGSIPVPKSFSDSFDGKPGLHRRESESWGQITPDDYRAGRAHYYAYSEQIDAQIGRILDALKEVGQEDNTIVVATTDHGDMVGAHRMWLKGWIPYEETYRVPLIIRWRGHIRPGSKLNTWCRRTTWHIHTPARRRRERCLFRRAMIYGRSSKIHSAATGPTIVCAPTTEANSCIRRESQSRIDLNTCSTGLISTSLMTCRKTRKRCGTLLRTRKRGRTWMTCAQDCMK